MEYDRIVEASRSMLHRVLGAWDKDKAVDWNDVYDCVFERQTFKVIQIQRTDYIQALKNVAYIHFEGNKIWSHLVGRPDSTYDMRMNDSECWDRLRSNRADMIQSREDTMNQGISEYVQQFIVRFGCLPEKWPYNNPRVADRNQMIKQARKESKARDEREVEKGLRSIDMQMPKSKYGTTEDFPGFQEGGQAGDADSSSEDENLAQGQHFGIYHSDSVTEDMNMIVRKAVASAVIYSRGKIDRQNSVEDSTARYDPTAEHTTPATV